MQKNNFWNWQIIISILSLIAMVVYLILNFGTNMTPLAKNSPLLFVLIIGGIPLSLQIIFNLFKGDFGADLLAAIALGVATYLEEYLAANLIIFMLASGQALELYAAKKASSVLSALAERMPSTAHLKVGKKIKEIHSSEIKVGDEIVIYPHEICPIDGTVIDGNGVMDESYLTGEPYHISKTSGSPVLSGAINGSAVLTVRAEKLASDSRYAEIMQVMEEAENKRPKLRRLADQIGSIFTPIALVFALGTWYFTADLSRFLSVLVIATPCPLLIAIPITIISAISMAARRGIIIKDPTVLERLPTCRTAIFDKTGTLTYGQPELSEIITDEGIDKETILQQTASIERYSRHPLAIAILEAAKKENLHLLDAKSVMESPGQGLEGIVGEDKILITSRKKIATSHPKLLEKLPETSAGLEFIVLINGKYGATFRLRDKPRDDGYPFVNHLEPSHGFNRIILLSGDRESEVSYLANLFKIKKTYSSQSPEDKVRIVRKETAKAPTLFMGDGINDAPALAAATVGIAFGQNNNVTAQAAGAVIMDNTLVKVDELIHISEAMRRIAAQSAIGGMIFSILGMGLAAAGLITPVYGALLQEIIDVAAILNALRMTWQPNIVIDIPGVNRVIAKS